MLKFWEVDWDNVSESFLISKQLENFLPLGKTRWQLVQDVGEALSWR